jgi:hypothetical protein
MPPIWNSPASAEQPEYTLVDWCIVETDKGERHLLGYSFGTREGRVSSAIQTLDAETRTGITRSGGVYRLRGAPGSDPDAWERWRRVNAVTSWRVVTDEVFRNKDTEFRVRLRSMTMDNLTLYLEQYVDVDTELEQSSITTLQELLEHRAVALIQEGKNYAVLVSPMMYEALLSLCQAAFFKVVVA